LYHPCAFNESGNVNSAADDGKGKKQSRVRKKGKGRTGHPGCIYITEEKELKGT